MTVRELREILNSDEYADDDEVLIESWGRRGYTLEKYAIGSVTFDAKKDLIITAISKTRTAKPQPREVYMRSPDGIVTQSWCQPIRVK